MHSQIKYKKNVYEERDMNIKYRLHSDLMQQKMFLQSFFSVHVKIKKDKVVLNVFHRRFVALFPLWKKEPTVWEKYCRKSVVHDVIFRSVYNLNKIIQLDASKAIYTITEQFILRGFSTRLESSTDYEVQEEKTVLYFFCCYYMHDK